MAGVTILGSEIVMTEHPLFEAFAIIGICFLVLALILGLIFKNKDYGAFVMLVLGVIGTIIAFGGMGWASINRVEDYVKYDVLVSENVMFQEFYNKYEILEAKGQVYTVKEIEVDD
jgi:asparagine N-glycosylation enzyme membrane subunit Stt3